MYYTAVPFCAVLYSVLNPILSVNQEVENLSENDAYTEVSGKTVNKAKPWQSVFTFLPETAVQYSSSSCYIP